MTLCPLQFPGDTVPLLPSSSELRGTRLFYQNWGFVIPKQACVESVLVQLARAGFWQEAQYGSLGKEVLCISLITACCCESTEQKVFISLKICFQGKFPHPYSFQAGQRHLCAISMLSDHLQTLQSQTRSLRIPPAALPTQQGGMLLPGQSAAESTGYCTCSAGLSNATC